METPRGPALILGGAPSLPTDLERLPEALRSTATRVSANEHGARLGPVQWVVCGDRNHQVTREPMLERVRQFHDGPVVTQHFVEGTVRLHNWHQWYIPASSGHMAILWAWLLGHSPIIVCGIEHYTGGTYFHDPKFPSSGFTKRKDYHLDWFKKLYFQIQPCTIRAASGPLGKVVGYFDPKETLSPSYRRHHRRDAYWLQTIHPYQFTKTNPLTRVGPTQFSEGDIAHLTDAEAKDGLKFGWLRRLKNATSQEDPDQSGLRQFVGAG